MSGNLQPLDQQFPIVGPDGRPTLYFIKWAQQRQIDIGDSITLSDLGDYLAAHLLHAGTGIGLAPDGNLANGPTITAKVQEILDQISATRGVVLYRGAAGWAALVPGTAGFVLSTGGAGADPSWIAAGGGGGSTYEIAGTPPVLANFTYMSPIAAGYSLTQKTYGIEDYHTSASGGAFTMARFNTAPNLTTGQIITARMASTDINFGTGYDMALMLRNSTNGRFVAFMNYNNGSGFLSQNWTSTANMATSGFSGNLTNATYYGNAKTFPWRRVVIPAGGASFTYQVSTDGDTWHDVAGSVAITLASYLTAAGGGTLDQVGFGAFGVRAGSILQSWTMV